MDTQTCTTKEERFAARLKATGIEESSTKASGGIVYFEALTGDQARLLMAVNAANGEDSQNDAPTFAEITSFLEAHPRFFGHGYIVLPSRDDERITMEGVTSDAKLTQADKDAFIQMFRRADEFELTSTYARCWYD